MRILKSLSCLRIHLEPVYEPVRTVASLGSTGDCCPCAGQTTYRGSVKADCGRRQHGSKIAARRLEDDSLPGTLRVTDSISEIRVVYLPTAIRR